MKGIGILRHNLIRIPNHRAPRIPCGGIGMGIGGVGVGMGGLPWRIIPGFV